MQTSESSAIFNNDCPMQIKTVLVLRDRIQRYSFDAKRVSMKCFESVSVLCLDIG